MHSLTPKSPNKPLYKYQQSLPKLPVPTLQETIPKYLKSVKAVVSPAEFEKTQAVAREFLTAGGVGETLQKRLEERAKTEKTSWLYEWWNDWSYMGYRDPVVVYVSYFFVFRDEVRRQWRNPARRAAALATAALEFRRLTVEEDLEPEMAKSGALSMDQYQWMFNSCRIPAIPSDTTRVVDPAQNNEILVIRKNKFFTFNTLHADGTQLSTAEIAAQIENIYGLAGDKPAAPIGVLTAENRDLWTKQREELVKSPKNREALDAIERAAFVICLDDTSPVTRNEASRACWHGDGRNRFFDKPLQFIVFENGKAGFLGEHSMMDGTPTSRLCDWVLDNLSRDKINHGSTTVSPSLPAPRQLEFEVTATTTSNIKSAEANFDKLIGEHSLNVQAYTVHGKDLIKKFKASPDAYAQMAIQLAYYKMHGVSRPTYESAQTRKFAFGRTETCRTVSEESVAWVKAMEDPDVPVLKKAELGRKALAAHVAYMADAVENKGVDRHLLGLKLSLQKGEAVPSLFTDPAFEYSKHWYLSTSQLTSEYFDGYGWGEVVPDGYGIAYMIKERSLHFNVGCRNEMHGERMHHFLHAALDDMRFMFEAELAASGAGSAPAKAKL
ncbi:acyltransferase ChoActase/COT/CPT [Cladochytrium replicatum]|nr:acyltransferase ChoActase/COT/CPT [Cladochytrium replicatum]